MLKHIEFGVLLVLIFFFFQGIVNDIYKFEKYIMLSHQRHPGVN